MIMAESLSQPGEFSAALLAQVDEVARLYPAVYQRFHVSRQAIPGLDVTPRMLGVVQHLAMSGPLTTGELVQHLGLSKAATTELIDRLVARNLVARMPDERDRRKVFIWLTDSGRSLAEKGPRVLADDTLAQAMSRMQPEDRSALIHGLQTLLTAAKEIESHDGHMH
jgi:DNA-binding MarR family transcriptional regulator